MGRVGGPRSGAEPPSCCARRVCEAARPGWVGGGGAPFRACPGGRGGGAPDNQEIKETISRSEMVSLMRRSGRRRAFCERWPLAKALVDDRLERCRLIGRDLGATHHRDADAV